MEALSDRTEGRIHQIQLYADNLHMIADALEFGEGGDKTKANSVRAVAKGLEKEVDALMGTVQELIKMEM